MNRIRTKFADYFALFSLFVLIAFGASKADAQSYPSRPTFLSAGVGCNPNLFAQNYIGMTTNGFLCIGGYPNASGGAGRLYLLSGTNPVNNAAEIASIDLANGNDGLSIRANGFASIITLDDQLVDIDGGDAISLTSELLTFGRRDDSSLNFVFTGVSDVSTTASPAFRAIANSVGTATFSLDTVLEMGGPFGALDTAFVVNYTEAGGLFNSLALTAPALDLTGVVSLLGSSDLVMTSGEITDSNGAVIVGDDFSATGAATFGDDVAVTDEFSVGGTSDFGAAMNVDGVLTVDSCVGCAAAGAPYGGYTDSGATAENVPTGWSVAVVGTVYTWTHNLGLATNTDLAISCSCAAAQTCGINVGSFGANSFATVPYADGDTSFNTAHMCTAVIVDN